MRPHIEIESDPVVWNQVESLIRSEMTRWRWQRKAQRLVQSLDNAIFAA